MQPLTADASLILDRMEPDRRYESQDLRAFVPDMSVERLCELMHELWVGRHVERVGYSGWRRQSSTQPSAPHREPRPVRHVKPEELFDHATFSDFFK